MIDLFLSVAIFLNFVPYFIEGISDSITSLRKNFRNDIGSGIGNILKRSCRCVLIASTFTDSNRLLDGSYFNYQRIANLKDRAFRISKNIVIAG
jgi:hypothetical protein